MFKKISKFAVYILVFLLPLFFLPLTTDFLELQKQALLFVVTLIALACWLVYILTSQKLELNGSLTGIAAGVFVLVVSLSTLFSVSRYGSFWGLTLPASSSLLTLLSFAALYLTITNLFKKEEILFVFLTLFASGFLAACFFVAQIFGKFILPFDFAKTSFFNTVGEVSALAIYLALLLILTLPLLFSAKRFFKVVLWIFSLTFLFALILTNFRVAWLVFLVGAAILFSLMNVILPERKEGSQSSTATLVLITFLIIGLFFAFSRFSFPALPYLPLEITPSHGASFRVLTSLPKSALILGTGPGTFVYAWSRYKPAEINQTDFWGVRFSKPSSEILDIAISTGILGILAFFFLVAAILKSSFATFLKSSSENSRSGGADKFLLFGILAGLAGILVAFFLRGANITILLLFWLLVAFSTLLRENKKLIFDLRSSSVLAMAVSFAAVLILLFFFGLAILYAQKYFAQTMYFQGLKAFQSQDMQGAQNRFLRSVSHDPLNDVYWRDLSQIFLLELQGVLARTDLSQAEMTSRAQGLIADAANSASQATMLDPQNVANWNIRGFVLRNMVGILGGAEEWAVFSYKKAKELEPDSPYILTELGRAYILKADILTQQGKQEEREENLALALENFEKAILLKSDYAPAHFQIAMAHIRGEKTAQALAKLEQIKQISPFDAGLAFQIGLIYYNDEQFDKAEAEFDRAVSIDPDYSNARYFLGLIADRNGNREQAISHFLRIEQLNPENQEVKRILANLRAQRPALEGVVPGQPPIEKKPKENLE